MLTILTFSFTLTSSAGGGEIHENALSLVLIKVTLTSQTVMMRNFYSLIRPTRPIGKQQRAKSLVTRGRVQNTYRISGIGITLCSESLITEDHLFVSGRGNLCADALSCASVSK